MSEATVKRKRSEEDVTDLLQRYGTTIILGLLQEVSEYTTKHSDSVKIDWTSLVKNTTTGICNAREYQMLWRHLAYHCPLLEKIEDGAEPLDDDSDLEFELEAVPAPNPEDLAEAEECAKVILSTGSPRICGSTPRANPEASVNGDTPNDHALIDPSDKPASSTSGPSTVVPVSAQKQSTPSGPYSEGLDGNGSGNSNLPAKKKRQLWTKEEDDELIAAVNKCGEGNWANILKGDFKHNRTASQLSQRWALIRKRQITNPGNGSKISSSARSEERLAAQKAFSLAVDMPMTGNISGLFSAANHVSNSSTSSAATSQASRASAAKSLNQFPDKGTSSPFLQSRSSSLKKPGTPGKPLMGPNPSIQAAAFAAGGRIANPSTVMSLYKAAQSKNAVHIRPGGVGVGTLPISSSILAKPCSISSSSSNLGIQTASHLRPIRPSVTQSPAASFGTTLSSQRSSQPASLPSGSATSASESKLEGVPRPSVQEKPEVKSSVCSDNTDIGGEELQSKDVGGVGHAVAEEKKTNSLDSSLSGIQITVEKEDRPQKDVSKEQVLVSDASGSETPVKELKESGSAGNLSVGDKILGEAEAVAVQVNESCSESSITADTNPLVDGGSL